MFVNGRAAMDISDARQGAGNTGPFAQLFAPQCLKGRALFRLSRMLPKVFTHLFGNVLLTISVSFAGIAPQQIKQPSLLLFRNAHEVFLAKVPNIPFRQDHASTPLAAQRLRQAITVPGEYHDVRVMNQAVHKRRRQAVVPEDRVPLPELQVRRDDQALLLVAV